MHKAQVPNSSDWNTFAESFSFTPPVHNSNGPLWYLSDADQFIGNRQCRSFETYQKSVTHQVWNLHFIVLSLILFSVCFCFDRFYCGINFLWQGVAGKDNRGSWALHTVWATISKPFDAEKTSWSHHDKILPIFHEGSMSFVLPFYQTYDNWPPAVCWPITHVWCNQSSVNHNL